MTPQPEHPFIDAVRDAYRRQRLHRALTLVALLAIPAGIGFGALVGNLAIGLMVSAIVGAAATIGMSVLLWGFSWTTLFLGGGSLAVAIASVLSLARIIPNAALIPVLAVFLGYLLYSNGRDMGQFRAAEAQYSAELRRIRQQGQRPPSTP